MVEKIIEHIESLQKLVYAYQLLETLFYEIGPYKNGTPSEHTWIKVRELFKFDDSE